MLPFFDYKRCRWRRPDPLSENSDTVPIVSLLPGGRQCSTSSSNRRKAPCRGRAGWQKNEARWFNRGRIAFATLFTPVVDDFFVPFHVMARQPHLFCLLRPRRPPRRGRAGREWFPDEWKDEWSSSPALPTISAQDSDPDAGLKLRIHLENYFPDHFGFIGGQAVRAERVLLESSSWWADDLRPRNWEIGFLIRSIRVALAMKEVGIDSLCMHNWKWVFGLSWESWL